MIVYSSTKTNFCLDVLSNKISQNIRNLYVKETGFKPNPSEVVSWTNSMQFMKNIMDDPEIPDNAGVAIEYKIPQTSKRIDFIITGLSDENIKTAILIELKQWSQGVSVSEKDAVVNTAFFGETNHPSYQAWSYSTLLNDYNSVVQDKNIKLEPCAYLHNYIDDDNVLSNDFYSEWTEKAPIFFSDDFFKLRNFVRSHVKHGDDGTLMYEIDNGKIHPSKSLADSLHSMLNGNKEFNLIDTQKIVYESALKSAKESTVSNKNVLIVKGGPGTGKSVVAINLLVELTNSGLVAQYVTRNSAPREVFQVMLTGKFSRTRISNLFTSSGSFHNIESNTFDALIVDEAQRLNLKSGLFSNKGENQIVELIKSSKFTIFFIDEDQRIHIKDIGEIDLIKDLATKNEASVQIYELDSQFRCNGSDGYLAWIDDVLQIRETANSSVRDIDYDVKVINNPTELHRKIIDLNHKNNKSRMLAGYCWNWISKNNPHLKDITIDEYSATWNLTEHGQAWIVHPESVKEVGCIHTSQGLELDFAGVIIGPDLIVRDGRIITDISKRASSDKSIHGYKKMLKESPEEAVLLSERIIKNTYRVLLSRGMKGTYIYSTDEETQDYFLKKTSNARG